MNNINKPVPLKGGVYHAFDDGKINPDRHMLLRVLDVWGRISMKPWMIAVMKYNAEKAHWIFNDDTDYFIETICDKTGEKLWFARSKDGGWYSLQVESHMDSCLLDVNGSFWESMVEYYSQNVKDSRREEFDKFVMHNTI